MSSAPIIRVENLGKCYRIKHQADRPRYTALRDVISEKARAIFTRRFSEAPKSAEGRIRPTGEHGNIETPPSARSLSEAFWALRNVSFEVKQGEVIGIVGPNGAGKSTLLKILSRITEPTEGRVRIKGRVASLLEVGTGFHPELTGRENIFLNGAILGMSRVEIKKKFDEIVAFAEVEKFLDTPVKRYSSGMYVRLAFAVAAHLEPEILIVDEVLAVGDAEFQKKCLGKMQEVSRGEGRTVLFVSHNMQAIRGLCHTGLLLEGGRVLFRETAETVVSRYLAASQAHGAEIIWPPDSAPGKEGFWLLRTAVIGPSGEPQKVLSTGNEIRIEMDFLVKEQLPSGLCIGFDLTTPDGLTVLRSYQTDARHDDWPEIRSGFNRLACSIPAGLLNGGVFHVCPRVGVHNIAWYVNLDAVLQFELVLDHGVSPLWNSLTHKSRTGVIAPVLSWTRQPVESSEAQLQVAR